MLPTSVFLQKTFSGSCTDSWFLSTVYLVLVTREECSEQREVSYCNILSIYENILRDMSNLATVTHNYQKAASPFPELSSKWISQSLWAQAANALSKHVSLVSFEGSVASGSNLTLFFSAGFSSTNSINSLHKTSRLLCKYFHSAS